MLLAGERDEYCPPEALRTMGTEFKVARVDILEGTDHYLWRREREAATLIGEFVDEAVPGQPANGPSRFACPFERGSTAGIWAARSTRTGRTGTRRPTTVSTPAGPARRSWRRHRPRATGSPTRAAARAWGRAVGDDVGLNQSRSPAHGRAVHPPSVPEQHHDADREERQGDEREDDEQQVLAVHARQPSAPECLTPETRN